MDPLEDATGKGKICGDTVGTSHCPAASSALLVALPWKLAAKGAESDRGGVEERG